MDNKEFNSLIQFVQTRDFKSFEKAIAVAIINDAKANSKHNITWNYNFSTAAMPRFGYDLVGQDLSTGSNIYVEIKTGVDRRLLLATIAQFRKARTIGYDNDLYIYVCLDKEKKQLSYYDLSSLVKSTQVEIGDGITQAFNNPKESIAAFLGEVPKKAESNLEVVGNESIPNVEKKNRWPFISKIISIGVALLFLLTVFVLDFIGVYQLSYERLILIGMVTLVCLFLFIKELKIKDWVYLSTIAPKDK